MPKLGLGLEALAEGLFLIAGGPVFLGITSQGPNPDSGNQNTISASKFTTGGAFSVTSMGVYVGAVGGTPNDKAQLAIYTDSAGPNLLVAASGDITLLSNQFNTIALSASLAASTTYWLAYNSNGITDVNNLVYSTGISGDSIFKGQTYGTWPSPMTGFTASIAKYSIYATGT